MPKLASRVWPPLALYQTDEDETVIYLIIYFDITGMLRIAMQLIMA
jgi:hypothetical protein